MKHYLVIQLARFGDLIQTKRLLASLCAKEGAFVHLCVDASLESLARLVYPDVTVHPIAAHGTGLHGTEAINAMLVDNRRAFVELKAIDFDTIYNLNFSPLNFRLAALFNPDRVEGYSWNNGQEIVGLWPTMAMRWSEQRRIGINLVDFWAGYCPDMIKPEDVNPIAEPKGGGIGVVLAGRESRRSLPLDILSQITSTVVSSHKADTVYLLGGNAEIAAGQSVLKQLPSSVQGKVENLAGKTSWDDLVEIVGSLDMLITPDTGTMHLAAHLGTPVSAFFLSSAWCFETGPYGVGHTVYQAITECLPCLETQACNYDLKCLNCFSDPSLQRFLVTGKPEHAPKNLLTFASDFDDLGQTYIPIAGNDPDAGQRMKFREFIRQYLMGNGGAVSDLDSLFAQRIYRDRDWITQPEPGSTLGL